ncbi:tetratricopeptide repeat protein [Paenibacillus ginsengihumi]|uniref:tetratricopeptide repeat protein n=1 Tax=Paenibacillus ginsengihumi TaxID=431596 RepID=UPI00037E5198|nr:tetratricopeptide repeat protein [Paenibacillus ginsengihumi]
MSQIKGIIRLAVVVIVMLVAFRIDWSVGFLAMGLLACYGIYLNRAAFYAQKGNVAYSQGDKEGALAWMEKAYRTKPNHPQHKISYAFMLIQSGDTVKADQVLNEVLAGKPAKDIRMQAMLNKATVQWLQNKPEEALRLLEDLYGEFKNTTVYGNLGYFKLLQGKQLEQALAFNQEAYAFNDSDVTILDNLAQNYFLLGRLEEARDMYARAMEKAPKYAESYYYYALTLQRLGQTEEAREQIVKALEREQAIVTSVTREDIERLAEELGALREPAPNEAG